MSWPSLKSPDVGKMESGINCLCISECNVTVPVAVQRIIRLSPTIELLLGGVCFVH